MDLTILCAILAIGLSCTITNAYPDLNPGEKSSGSGCEKNYRLHAVGDDSDCTCKCRQCPGIADRCPYGMYRDTRDPCRCCDVCANGPGEYCDPDNDTFTEYKAFFAKWASRERTNLEPISLRWDPTKHHFGRCGDDMHCRPINDLPRRSSDIHSMSVTSYLRSIETVCVCKKDEMVCGSDGVTYDNRCSMKKAEVESKQVITEVGPGMCQGAPKLVMSPSDVVLRTGDRALLHCQFASQPVPEIEWRRKGTESAIPGDDVRFVIHQHGGPEEFMLTTWLDINDVTLDDAAMYECRGSNMYGTTTGSASVFVKDEI